MKRIAVLLVIIVFCFSCYNCLAENYDWTSKTTEELIEQMAAIQKELYSRNLFDNVLWPGHYVVGEDLEPGVYSISLVEQIQGIDGIPELLAIKSVRNMQHVLFEDESVLPKLNLLEGTKLTLYNGIFAINRISQ